MFSFYFRNTESPDLMPDHPHPTLIEDLAAIADDVAKLIVLMLIIPLLGIAIWSWVEIVPELLP